MTGRRLRILQVASHSKVATGGAIQMVRLATGLRARGHDVTCVFNRRRRYTEPGDGTFGPLLDAGFRVETFEMAGRRRRWPESARFGRLLAAERFDVVHTHKDRALKFVLMTGSPRPFGALVVNRGVSYPLDAKELALYRSPGIDRFVAVAGGVRDALVGSGLEAGRIEVIYGGVDPERFHPDVDGAPLRHELAIPADAPVIGMIANLDPKKSHRSFLDAAARVLRDAPEAYFLAVGQGDPAPLAAEARSLGLEGRLLFTGFRTDIPEVIAALDVSVNTAKDGEGLTGGLRESLAMAAPVVCTDVGGNRELVRHGETGIVVPAGDTEAMARAILDLLADPDRAGRLGRAGRDLVLEGFTNAVRAESMERLYREVLAESAR